MIKFLKTLARLFKKLFSEFGTVEGKKRRDEYARNKKIKGLEDEIQELHEEMYQAAISGCINRYNELNTELWVKQTSLDNLRRRNRNSDSAE